MRKHAMRNRLQPAVERRQVHTTRQSIEVSWTQMRKMLRNDSTQMFAAIEIDRVDDGILLAISIERASAVPAPE